MNDTAADILDLPPEGDYGLIFHKLTKSAGMKLQLEFWKKVAEGKVERKAMLSGWPKRLVTHRLYGLKFQIWELAVYIYIFSSKIFRDFF
jgi:hypothetical protein